jgi:hypothetical protein
MDGREGLHWRENSIIFPDMSITAIVEQDMVKLPAGMHVPDGTQVRLDILRSGEQQWPVGYFERTAGAIADEPMERPTQGEAPAREAW